jgi:hypothetical protein
MPPLPDSLENQRVGRGGLEIRTLSAMLPPGVDHLERAVLSPAAVDHYHAALRRDSLPLSRLPLQLRQFPSVPGKTQLADHGDTGYVRRAAGSQGVTPCFQTVDGRNMKCFAPCVRRALVLVIAISATALAQVPYQHPIAPPEPRRHNYEHPRKMTRLQMAAPRPKSKESKRWHRLQPVKGGK